MYAPDIPSEYRLMIFNYLQHVVALITYYLNLLEYVQIRLVSPELLHRVSGIKCYVQVRLMCRLYWTMSVYFETGIFPWIS